MKKLLGVILTLVFVLSFAAGCGKKEEAAPAPAPAPTQTEQTNTTPAGKNGTFKAEAKDFDDRGWKAYVEVTFENDKVTKVVMDEISKDGKKKSEDTGYNDAMKAQAKVSAAEAYVKLADTYVQTGKADVVTGATGTSTAFKTLVEEAVASAK
jgi:major membrane immunogen (membrane-anchored lipoprotein)